MLFYEPTIKVTGKYCPIVCTAILSRPWPANTLLWWGHQSTLSKHPKFQRQMRNICLLNRLAKVCKEVIEPFFDGLSSLPSCLYWATRHTIGHRSPTARHPNDPLVSPPWSVISHREVQPLGYPKGCICLPDTVCKGYTGQDIVFLYPMSKVYW